MAVSTVAVVHSTRGDLSASAVNPLDPQSAGFSDVLTCPTVDWLRALLLPVGCELFLIHPRTIVVCVTCDLLNRVSSQ
ncbi:unnamed protein product [Cylicocyclus nassatus]|uniref:Uncharacterized protein n=1 Tax=Cylicocyclus nassatus TaxID=53992 RepID=A0AA36M257_CYLNA|nr:unnamed protein product [Cylicocyclus nassatus]